MIGEKVVMHWRPDVVVRDALGRNLTLPSGAALSGTIINEYDLPGAPGVVDVVCVDGAGLTAVELGVTLLKDGQKRPRGLRYAEKPGRVQGPEELE